jgi:hypothetical protein
MYSNRIQEGKQKEEIKLPTRSARMLGDDLRLIGILPGECRASVHVATSALIMHLLKRIHQARDLIFHLLSLSLLGLKILDIAKLPLESVSLVRQNVVCMAGDTVP